MAYASLADYLEELAGCGQLARIAVEVDPQLEIAGITRRVARQQGPAVLFERVRGQSVAVVTNVLGSETRVCQALGIESLDCITARIESLIQAHTPRNWFERLKTSDDQAGADNFRAKAAKTGPCQQVVRLGRDVDAGALPLVTQWPGESGPAMTGALLVTQDLAAEQRAVTVCALQALAPDRMAVIDEGASPFARHWAAYRQAGQQMPVAVVVGGDPAGAIAAHIDLPPGVDFYHLTGLLRGKAVDLVTCRTHALPVPADADIILEGYLDPETPDVVVASSGIPGSYRRIERPAPVLHLAAITHRKHALLPLVIDTAEQGEAGALLKVRERVLLPALRTIAPGIVDLHLPALGGLDTYAFVSLRKTYAHQARQVASALWGSAALRFTKFLVLVDAEVDVRDARGVLAEMGAHATPQRDMFSYDGPAPAMGQGGASEPLTRHIGIDATTKIAGESSNVATAGPVAAAERLTASSEIERLVEQRWSEYGLGAGRSANP